jgi:hypothetical protein
MRGEERRAEERDEKQINKKTREGEGKGMEGAHPSDDSSQGPPPCTPVLSAFTELFTPGTWPARSVLTSLPVSGNLSVCLSVCPSYSSRPRGLLLPMKLSVKVRTCGLVPSV